MNPSVQSVEIVFKHQNIVKNIKSNFQKIQERNFIFPYHLLLLEN